MAVLYVGNGRIVERKFFARMRYTLRSGRTVRGSWFVAERLLAVRDSLYKAGHDINVEPELNTEFWEYILDLRESPDTSLHHKAEATISPDERAGHLLAIAYPDKYKSSK